MKLEYLQSEEMEWGGGGIFALLFFFMYAEQSSRASSDTHILNNPINNTHYLDDFFAK